MKIPNPCDVQNADMATMVDDEKDSSASGMGQSDDMPVSPDSEASSAEFHDDELHSELYIG